MMWYYFSERKLYSVDNITVNSTSDVNLRRPNCRNGFVFCVFFDFDAETARVSPSTSHAGRIFYNAVFEQQQIPLCINEKGGCTAAADACADEYTAGIGGWWLPAGSSCHPANIHWFSWQLTCASLPKWFKAKDSSSLQSSICALEALAQLVLLLLRVQQGSFHGSRCSIALRQLCDNAGVVFSYREEPKSKAASVLDSAGIRLLELQTWTCLKGQPCGRCPKRLGRLAF